MHERDRAAHATFYIVWSLATIWRERGIDVRVHHGLRGLPQADVLFPHLTVSRMPPEYAAVLDGHPRVVNRGVRDVTKRSFSRQLVRPGDGWEGPVIVKTDRNCGGVAERAVYGHWEGRRARLRRALRRLVGLPAPKLAFATHMESARYPVFASVGEVPPGVFRNRALVVERLLPERIGDRYCLRNYTFLGERFVCARRRGPHPVVKAGTDDVREEVDVSPEIEAERQRLAFDYGKFDWVVHEGRPVLLDVNPTPTYAGFTLTEAQRQRSEHLADGIVAWIEGA
jgi:hypothetical protein